MLAFLRSLDGLLQLIDKLLIECCACLGRLVYDNRHVIKRDGGSRSTGSDLPTGVYILRHTFCSHLVMRGGEHDQQNVLRFGRGGGILPQPATIMPSIFVCYRREDAAPYAGRLYDRLVRQFGPAEVGMDIDALQPGESFETQVRSAIANLDVMLVVIGLKWRDARGRSGNSRLNDPGDFVRMEIATALESGVPTIPILVGGADYDLIHGLPEDIQRLAHYQAAILRDENWEHDIQQLIATLQHFGAKGSTKSRDSGGTRQAVPAPSRTKSKPSAARRPPQEAQTSQDGPESSRASADIVEGARDIFISYVEEDGATALALAVELRKQQLSTWMYEEDGVPGISHLTQVFEAIESCRALVLIASTTSVKAKNVIREVEAAHDRDKMIIPVRLGLTHDQFTASSTILRMATGTAVSSSLDGRAPADIAKRIATAIRVARKGQG